MAWIILEGLDRTGKSTVANLYKNKGYQVIHMSAPSKEYLKPGYVGPSYVDEILEMYLKYTGADVVFDRSVYGEFVWPEVYGRKAAISDEDMEALQDIEAQNLTQHILLYDPDVASHWQRCVENKEPMTKEQFKLAGALFDKMATQYGFARKRMQDFGAYPEKRAAAPNDTSQVHEKRTQAPDDNSTTVVTVTSANPAPVITPALNPQEKLAKANAISEILAKRILKKSGDEFDALENDIRGFLQDRLSTILGDRVEKRLSDDEVDILKLYCQQIRKKLEEKR